MSTYVKAFEFDGHIFAIIPPKKSSDDEIPPISFVKTPFDLEDFKV